MIDAHFHYDQEMNKLILKHKITGIVNVQNPSEYPSAIKLKQCSSNIFLSIGIHPWDVEKITIEMMRFYYQKADVIGEIGLDHTWCECDFTLQYEVFEKQLQIAHQFNKPVIIHMMGYEQEVLSLIKKYPNKYMIHWVKPHELLKEFIKLGCYFSVAFDYEDEVIKQIPINQLLLESDGLESLKWLNLKPEKYIEYYQHRILKLSKLKELDIYSLKIHILNNLYCFLL